MRSRLAAAIVSIGLVAVVLAVVVRRPEDDGFPLSTFPMFASPRPATLSVGYAQGVTAAGAARALRVRHLGTSEAMQAFAMLQRGVGGKLTDRQALCQAIAARVAADEDYREVVAIRLLWGQHDAVAYLADGTIGHETERARCAVARAP
ncbi:MAG TPA: hypothetical protein VGC42_08900 [Kofleriaceae bacterium]